MLETLDYTIRIGSTSRPTFLYFDLYLYSAYAHTTFIDVNIHFDSEKHVKCLYNY